MLKDFALFVHRSLQPLVPVTAVVLHTREETEAQRGQVTCSTLHAEMLATDSFMLTFINVRLW